MENDRFFEENLNFIQLNDALLPHFNFYRLHMGLTKENENGVSKKRQYKKLELPRVGGH
jgi:hypothetical protein